MIQEINPLIRNNASDEDLIAAVTKPSTTEKERNLVQGKHHKKALRLYQVSDTCNRSGQAEMGNKVDNSGSGKVDKLLSAVDALTKQVNSLNCGKSKMKKGVKHIIVEVNLYVDIVLTITRVIVTIVINVGHQVIWHVDVTHHYGETKCNYWCWAPGGR